MNKIKLLQNGRARTHRKAREIARERIKERIKEMYKNHGMTRVPVPNTDMKVSWITGNDKELFIRKIQDIGVILQNDEFNDIKEKKIYLIINDNTTESILK